MSTTSNPSNRNNDDENIRLQKVLASAGIGSRRKCEDLIAQGRVTVDGKRAELGQRVNPVTAVIMVNGDRVPTAPGLLVLAFNKPKGYLSTMSDDEGRPCIGDYFLDRKERLFHVGRLDLDTEGLILLTNDGELANRLAHPSHGVSKTYVAEVTGQVARDISRRFREGIELEDGIARADSFKLLQSTPNKALVEVVLHEGRKHIVRRMLAAVNLPVDRLVRTQVGSIRLGELRPAMFRVITGDELGALYTEAGL